MLVLGGSTNVCVNPESGEACAFTIDLQFSPAQEEQGTWLSVLVFYASPVRRCCCRQCLVCSSLCVWPRQHPVRVCVSLAYELIFASG